MKRPAKTDKVLERYIETVRLKFDGTVDQRLSDAFALLPVLAGSGPEAAQAVQTAYNAIHPICGIAATIGYPSTGTGARKVDNALVASFRAKRGLNHDEADNVRAALLILRSAVETELPNRVNRTA